MPGHLIAVLVGLGVNAFVVQLLALVVGAVVASVIAAPLLGGVTLMFGSLALLGWFGSLVYGLAMRRAWAPRRTRVTALLMCGVGVVAVALALVDPALAVVVDLAGGDAVAQLGLGLYVLWAVGRADVRAWLAGAIDRD